MTPAVLALVLAMAGVALPGQPAAAQSATASQAAQKALQSGLSAQKARNHPAAISLLSRAINSGALSRKQMMYALYRRAVSNRAQRQTAQAISDLNNALFFKGDLSSRDRADAIEERMKAFKDAGLQPTSVATASSAAQWSPSSSTSNSIAQPPRSRIVSTAPRRVVEPIKVTKPIGSSAALPAGASILAPAATDATTRAAERSISPFQTRVAATPVKPAIPSARTSSFLASKVERGVGVPKQPRKRKTDAKPALPSATWQVATTSAPVVTPSRVATQPSTAGAATPATGVAATAKPAPTASASGGGVGQFFSSFFGGGTSAPAASQQTTGSLEPSGTAGARTAATTSGARSAPAASAATAKPVQVAAVQPTAVAPVSRPAGRGRFEIEVAQLRSKDRADALAKQLVVQYSSSSFWSTRQTARVREKPAVGDEGVIYSVRYGLYNSKNALSSTCDQFKAAGLDCEPVRED
ncbi:MAG: SPOR domain-containing protein [Hyphomicrobiaceae bacterium]